jgi:deoxyribonuclease V
VHAWVPADDFTTLTAAQAMALQEELAERVREEDVAGRQRLVAGADVAYDPETSHAHAAVAVWDASSGKVVETATAERHSGLRYVPGLFAWRELPAVLAAWQRLHRRPELLLVDGHGRAHPRRCGIACLLGLAVDVPTIGCAKSVLVGSFSGLAAARGARAPVVHAGEVVGAALRTRTGVRPVIVSVGHRVTLAAACTRVLAASRFRIPEPLRAAHAAARRHADAERSAGRDGG